LCFLSSDAAHKGPNLPLILGLVITLTGLGLLIGLAILFYKRRKREQDRRDNQRARLLPTGDVSEVHLPREHADLPHPRPPFSTRAWPGGSIENLGSALRATPFIWPMGGRDSSSPRDRDPGVTGTSTARPGFESRSTSSSGMLRRLRSNRFPFGAGSGGYQSLGDDSTPSSNLQNTNTTNNSSGFGSALATGHNTSYSNDSSASAVHKSPLPASYLQHVSQNSHGSDGSRLGHVSPTRMSSDNAQAEFSPLMSGGQHTLTRPGPAPLGPRPAPGSSRPSFGRLDTAGSVWEVPPTYDSLRRQQARGS
jgi:LPXTG-motif cell wall-anchored protein